MENAAYVGLSRQMTLRRELDIVANNIANADTTGFKVEQLLVGAEVGERARNAFVRPGVSFVLDNGVGRDFGQGALGQTGRDLDFAIEGEGAFFKLTDGQGDAYTRDGAFTVDGEGRLVTEGGAAVQGDAGDIILDPALGEPSVAPDGTISQNGALVGRLSVVRFDTLAALEKGGDGLYRNASNAAAVEAPDARVRQGMLEGSNVNPILEITNLIEIQRAYESVTRMIENTNDLSRRAVERLGRA
ncbi:MULTISPECIES: flagellar basal-body rod protein FlgF [unclassified Brevundimonas]|uniref:flagellar basal-body rod protein FlgF n=1 Tax=unclassified Brevundimonas TaxID=2622653 RepID=UPI0006FF72A6|nr:MULTISPECIES: flagellar basal-body rod protein FlgF [unclassified Brevundimonas]KQY66810.1 flagellar biosynthesis protein FlgF [Brevundimonas sp. Root1423]KRA22788.1 flagellar biosynthesis protein FlgF [Brevundimonas sp. Root608]